jgi:catechol 2,3-dioxygenase-like lactoylglutathione lyase family enzyme
MTDRAQATARIGTAAGTVVSGMQQKLHVRSVPPVFGRLQGRIRLDGERSAKALRSVPMDATIDHVVLWSDDPVAAVDFYVNVVGLAPVRVGEFRAGTAPFPSIRVSSGSIIDVMARGAAPMVDALSGGDASAGHRVNHVCLAMGEAEFTALRGRLEAHGTPVSPFAEQSFGARGLAPRAFYFRDPDGNVVEARYYA